MTDDGDDLVLALSRDELLKMAEEDVAAPLRSWFWLARAMLRDDSTRARWVIIDGLSCAISVGVPYPQPTGRADPGQSTRDELEKTFNLLVERFLIHPTVRSPILLRRPALQLVVFPAKGQKPDGDCIRTVEEASRRLESTAGAQLPDFRVTLVEYPAADTPSVKDLESPAKEMHLPFLVAEPADTASKPDIDLAAIKLSDLCDSLDHLREDVEEAIQLAQGDAKERKPDDRLDDLLTHPIWHDAFSLHVGLESEEQQARRPAQQQLDHGPPHAWVPLEFRVRGRHWHKGREVGLPLTSLNLVLGDNAAGKTSLLEGLTLLLRGIARPRAIPPDGSESFGDDGQLTLHAACTTEIEHRHFAQLLPIFADDIDIAKGAPGDLSVATLWQHPNVHRLSPALQALPNPQKRLKDALEKILTICIEHLESAENSVKSAPSGTLEWLRESEDASALKEAAAQFREDQARRTQQDEAAGQVWARVDAALGREPDADPIVLDAADLYAVAEHWLSHRHPLEEGRLIPKGWSSTRDLLVRLGREDLVWGAYRPALEEARRRLMALRDSIERSIGDAVDALERKVPDLATLSWQFDQYLSHDVVGLPPPQRGNTAAVVRQVQKTQQHQAQALQRRNTAAVVRLGVAERIARMLRFAPRGSAGLPMMSVDEPALGQHPTSSARMLARITRMYRAQEAVSWKHAFPAKAKLAAPTVLKYTTLSQGTAPPRHASGSSLQQSDVKTPVHSAVRPALPLLLLSYQSESLQAVARLEGQEYDQKIREDLKKLVPASWRAALAEALSRSARVWSAQAPSAGRAPPPWISHALTFPNGESEAFVATLELQESDLFRWETSGKEIKIQGWLSEAQKALDDLNLGALWPEGEHTPGGLSERLKKETNARAPYGWPPQDVLAELNKYARRLVTWLIYTDLLPAALDDGQVHLEISTVDLRRLHYEGGVAERIGPLRLRRVTPAMLRLPPDPKVEATHMESEQKASTSSVDTTTPAPLSATSGAELERAAREVSTPEASPAHPRESLSPEAAPAPLPQPSAEPAAAPESSPTTPATAPPPVSAPDAPKVHVHVSQVTGGVGLQVQRNDVEELLVHQPQVSAGVGVAIGQRPHPPAALTLRVQWTSTPRLRSLVESNLPRLHKALAGLGVESATADEQEEGDLIIRSSEDGQQIRHAIAAKNGPPLRLTGVFPPLEALLSRALLACFRARWKDEPPKRVEIGFHCGPYPWNREDTHLRLSAPEGDEEAIQQRYGRDLDILYGVLQEVRPRDILLNIAAPPGVALRIGWVFRDVTQMPVRFTGGPNFPDPWSVADPTATADGLTLERVGSGSTSNLHLVVLPTPNGQPEVYEDWRRSEDGPCLALIHTKKLMIPSGAVLAWARALQEQIMRNRRGPLGARTIRLFMSGPISLTYALGRLLNAVDVIVMDRAPPRAGIAERYVERFTLRR